MTADSDWIRTTRRANQFNQFKQQTLARYRDLEMSVLRDVETSSIEKTEPEIYFATVVNSINRLLDNVELRRASAGRDFTIVTKEFGAEVPPQSISSGESELISLGIECQYFAQTLESGERGMCYLMNPMFISTQTCRRGW